MNKLQKKLQIENGDFSSDNVSPSFSDSELLSELEPLLEPDVEVLLLPLEVLLSDRREDFGSPEAEASKINPLN